jgi:hypothetical protein
VKTEIITDRAFKGWEEYAVYKLTFAVITALRLNIRPAELDSIVERLPAQQSESGGRNANYAADGKVVGLANVATTSLAVLAIDSFAPYRMVKQRQPNTNLIERSVGASACKVTSDGAARGV